MQGGRRYKKVETSHEIFDLGERILVIETIIDDMNPELLSLACEKLFGSGALDVYTESIYMKKGRIGYRLTCISRVKDRNDILEAIFIHTSTLGIRVREEERFELEREFVDVDTHAGKLKVKVGKKGKRIYGVYPEFESLKQLSEAGKVSVKKILNDIVYLEKVNIKIDK